MASTVYSLITQARRILADGTDKSFAYADLVAFLNEGQKRFAAETHVCQAVKEATFSSGVVSLTFASLASGLYDSILMVIKAVDTTSLAVLPKSSLTDITTYQAASAAATRWHCTGDSIYLDKLTSSVTTVLSLVVSYVPSAIASTVTESSGDTTEVSIPSQWDSVLVRYVVYCAHLANRDAGLANGAYQEYLAGVKQAAALTITRAG